MFITWSISLALTLGPMQMYMTVFGSQLDIFNTQWNPEKAICWRMDRTSLLWTGYGMFVFSWLISLQKNNSKYVTYQKVHCLNMWVFNETVLITYCHWSPSYCLCHLIFTPRTTDRWTPVQQVELIGQSINKHIAILQ